MRARLPKMCRHKSSGKAYVTDPDIRREVYLGRYGSPEADEAYRQWAAAFLARRAESPRPAAPGLSVADLVLSYLAHVDQEFCRPGKPGRRPSEPGTVRTALAPAVRLFGTRAAAAFGPDELRAVREAMVAKGWARGHVNRQVGRLRNCWRWAVGRRLLPGVVLVELQAVGPLKRGRGAREGEKVECVPLNDLEATLPHLAARFATLVRVHWWNAMRPGEAVILRPCDITQEPGGTLWEYRPYFHKTEHHGKSRVIHLGRRTQAELAPLLAATAADGWLFPAAKGPGGRHVSVECYRRAVARACVRACVPAWSPLQLRHTALTEVRRKYGLEAAQVRAGHAKASTTEIYAERDESLARKIAEETS